MSSDWWASRLSGQAPQRPSLPQTQPRPVVVPSPGAPEPRFYQPQQQEEQYAPQKAQSIRRSHHCPECASPNYMEQTGGRARCFDCGYPIVQSTSGLMADPGAPSQAAQQVAGEGYGAQDIIGRI